MKPIQLLQSELNSPKNIVITTHQNPDADAFGSSLGLYHYLIQKGHKITVVSSTFYTNALAWMQGTDDILVLEKDEKAVIDCLQNSDLLFCLDFNVYTRTAGLANIIKDYQGIKVLIDHHLYPDEPYFDFGISLPEKSSTCEMIYDYILMDNGKHLINKTIADCLYAGVMTDTGGFRYSCTSASTHRMTADLLELGVVPNTIAENIYDHFEEKRLRLLGHIFSNRLHVIKDYQASLIYLDATDMDNFTVGQGDTEGIVNYPLSINGVNFSTFMSQKENEIRMSFRSKGNIDVNLFARTYFEGGGHANAAGGKSKLPMKQTIEAYHLALREFSKQYININ
jgi:bifunctional oligoribonuclease and PAP phosphatase NrnA